MFTGLFLSVVAIGGNYVNIAMPNGKVAQPDALILKTAQDIPFHSDCFIELNDDNNHVTLPVGDRKGSLYLLLEMEKGSDYARKYPWMGPVNEPCQFTVRVTYDDNTSEEYFPYNCKTGSYEISAGPGLYRVTPNFDKAIRNVTFHKSISSLIYKLWGVAVGDRVNGRIDELQLINTVVSYRGKTDDPFPCIAKTRIGKKEINITAANQDCTFSLNDGRLTLVSMKNMVIGREMLSTGNASVFHISCNGRTYGLNDFSLVKTLRSKDCRLGFELRCRDNNFPLTAFLELKGGADGLRWLLSIKNESDEKLKNVNVDFPLFEKMSVGGKDTENFYFYPYHGGIINYVDHSFDVNYLGETGYGEGVIMPMMILFNPVKNGNWSIMVQDITGLRKHFGLEKKGVSSVKVNYFPRDLAPGESRVMPSAVTIASRGNWRNGLDEYKKWSRKAFYDPRKVGLDWFRGLFTLNMTFHHFENPTHEPQGLAKDNTPRLGAWVDQSANLGYGKFDYFHLQPHVWCVSPDGKTESRGDYEYQAAGGLENFRKQVKDAHDRKVFVGVYTEGTLASEHTKIGKKLGESGRAVGPDGKPYMDYCGGNEGEINYNMCSAYVPWQNHLAKTARRIMSDVPLDGFYLDQIGNLGFRPCYNAGHNHPWPDESCYPGQLALVKSVFAAIRSVNPHAALYSEGIGPDVLIAERNGSFLWWTDYTQPRRIALTAMMPSRVNLVRQVFPEFKIFEIPTWGENHAELRQAFFNGNGIYLQIGGGDCPHYSDAGRALIKKMHDVYIDNVDAFVTSDIEMLTEVNSTNALVFANRFTGNNKTVFTIFNAGFASDVAEIFLPADADSYEWTNGWDSLPLALYKYGDKFFVNLNVGPRSVSCVVGHRK